MSATSVRRLKERGGGGGKIAAAPAGKISPVSRKVVASGKENPRSSSTSRVRDGAQKPSLRPIARVDKSAAAQAAEEPPCRRSTSSVPRGRSSSPSEFTRVLSDLRKNSTRASFGPSQRKVTSVGFKGPNEKCSEKSDHDKRVLKDLVKNGRILGESGGSFQDKEKLRIRAMNSVKDPENRDCVKNEGNLSTISMKRSDLDSSSEKSVSEFDKKSDVASEESKVKSIRPRLSSRESRPINKVNSFPEGPRIDNKPPNKLHEKLAFLEGKVKRIASDIKRTKEMLDMNNPDASKMILSDIQEKISGIEKAMGHVRIGDVAKSGEDPNKKEEIEVMNARSLVKGLNVEELEARLFPHHKLIRDRTLSKTQSAGSETHILKVEPTNVINANKGNASSDDGNAIAVEYLDSLNKEELPGGPEASIIQESDDTKVSLAEMSSLDVLNGKSNIHAFLAADEKLNEIDGQDGLPGMIFDEGFEENCTYKLTDIGCKTSSGGWFVSEGESVLLAHDDGSCSFYDVVNCEEKAEYRPPVGVLPNMWSDCWIIRAASADGCSGRYVIAASAGNSVGSGFCSWDFYSKEVRAFHFENETNNMRAALMYGRNALPSVMATENRQWFYKPCGQLITSAASCQRTVQLYDIRDGEQVMKWELQKPVLAMDYASPLHWRNRGKVVIAESDGISLWDVNSLSSEALLSVPSVGRKICALHVNNTDAELGGGVRQRISSQEAEGNDGLFCTQDSVNVLDFRHPSGIGLKIPKLGFVAHSASSHGDSIYVGGSSLISAGKKHYSAQIQQFSMRKQTPFNTYVLPESNAQNGSNSLTQVWGNSNYVMGVCGLGLFVFDSLKDNGLPSFAVDHVSSTGNVKEVIGPDDMYHPSFDHSGSRILLISKDRPARWRYLL